MRGIVNTVVGILGAVLFKLWCRVLVEVMVCLLYEDVMFCICVKNQQMHQLLIKFINYIW
jgi:hypothetical protein